MAGSRQSIRTWNNVRSTTKHLSFDQQDLYLSKESIVSRLVSDLSTESACCAFVMSWMSDLGTVPRSPTWTDSSCFGGNMWTGPSRHQTQLISAPKSAQLWTNWFHAEQMWRSNVSFLVNLRKEELLLAFYESSNWYMWKSVVERELENCTVAYRQQSYLGRFVNGWVPEEQVTFP